MAAVVADPFRTPACSASTNAPLMGWLSLVRTTVPPTVPVVAIILNAELVAEVRPADVAVSVYPLPAWLILRSLNAAMPLEAFLELVPLNVPPPGFVPMATVMDAEDDVTVLLKLSWTVVVGGPPMAAPALVFTGWVVKTTLLAAAAATLNALLVALVSPVDDAISV